MEHEEYIHHILREHLNNLTYAQLTNKEYKEHMEKFMLTASTYLKQHKKQLTKAEIKYFNKILYNIQTAQNYRDAQFYRTPNVQKDMTPYIRFLPVVS